MNAIEKRVHDLCLYTPDLTAKPDLDAYWNRTLHEFAEKPLHAERIETESPFPAMKIESVSYEGFDDTPIRGWYVLPASKTQEDLPCIVTFHGYTGGKGYPFQYAHLVSMGYAVFAVDVRGQGGETGNRLISEDGMAKGWVTQGILDRDRSYYKAIIVDCLKAIDWVWAQPEVDRDRIAVMGASQGGGLALACAALSDKPSLAISDVPNMCHMDYGVFYAGSGSLTEIASFCNKFAQHQDAALDTLSYFDVMNLAHRIKVPTMVSVGLKDPVCLPETVFAAYNRLQCEKSIKIYPFAGHEVTGDQSMEAVKMLKKHFG